MSSETGVKSSLDPQGRQDESGLALSTFKRSLDHFALTPLGGLSVGLGVYVYDRFGQREQDFLLYMMGSAFSVFALLLFVIAYIERWRLRRARLVREHLSSVEVEVGQDLMTGFSLPSIPRNPLFQLRVAWVAPKVSEYHLELFDGALKELIKPKRRGRVVEVTRVFTQEDLFGFTSLTWYERESVDLSVWPKTTPPHELQLRRPQSGEDLYEPSGETSGDLIELRRYVDGDPLKWVMWRVYARNRQLVVRSPERALSERRDLVVYFLAHSTDEPSASTTRAYLDAGMLGDDYLFIADGCQSPAQRQHEVMDHLLQSAVAEPLSALHSLLALPEPQQRGVVIFASVMTPPKTVMKAVHALPSPPLVIFSMSFEPDAMEEVSSPWWTTLIQRNERQDDLSRETLSLAVEHLEQLSSIREPLFIAQPTSRVIPREFFEDLLDRSSP